MKNIFFFTGKAQSGKDYIAEKLKQELENQGKTVLKLAYADELKRYLSVLLNISIDDVNKYKLSEEPFTKNGLSVRDLLQRLGTEIFRNEVNEEYWINVVAKKIKNSNYDYYIVTDCRFMNELSLAYCFASRWTVVKVVNRDCIKSSQHESEQGNLAGDITIDNTDHKYVFDLKDFLKYF